MTYLFQLGLTLLIELPIGVAIIRNKRAIPVIIAIDLITHPLGYLFYSHFPTIWGTPLETLVWLELIIALVEAVVLVTVFRRTPYRAIIAGAVMNACSFLIGVLLW